jgi:hypothetical protein
MALKNPIFSGFGKPGEKAEEKEASYFLSGRGTDLGCVLQVQEEINSPSLLELEIKGEINRDKAWTRLRIEIFDKKQPDLPATSFDEEFLMEGLVRDNFKKYSFPILGIVKRPSKVQIMVVGPSQTDLEIRHVHLR